MSDKKTLQRPAHSPPVRWWAVVLGVLLVVVAALAARELWVYYASERMTSWVTLSLESLQAADPVWTGIIGAVVVILGVIMLVSVFSPRSKPYRRVIGSPAPIWVRRVDVARLATATAKRFPGVLTASSLAERNQVTVSAEVLRADEDIQTRLQESISEALSPAFGEGFVVKVNVQEPADPNDRLAAAADPDVIKAAQELKESE